MHYTELFTSIHKHYPLHLLFVILRFVHPLQSAVSHLLQFLIIASHLNLFNTIATNILLRSVKINLMHIHIPPLIDVEQARCKPLYLTINKRHR